MNNQQIIQDALALSSGTISSLTGLQNYREIDCIQAAFANFIASQARTFSNWHTAWTSFSTSNEYNNLTYCPFCN